MTIVGSLIGAGCLGAIVSLGAIRAGAQAAKPGSTQHACGVERYVEYGPEKALGKRDFKEAERLYTEALKVQPDSFRAMAGMVRSELAAGHTADALALAIKYDAAYPNNAVLLDALGEVRYRRGEVAEAVTAYNRSIRLDPCSSRTHLDEYRYFRLSGLYATAQRELEMAHGLSPDAPSIKRLWEASHAVPQTPDEQIAGMKKRLEDPALTPDQRSGAEAAIRFLETRSKGDCELATPVNQTKIPIQLIERVGGEREGESYGATLAVQFNGKKKKLQIDTGASGILLSRATAISAGLVPELEVKERGGGDEGPANAFVTHIDSLRIGNLEYKNCMIRVLEQQKLLQDVDGLIGTDVFRDYLITLDVPDGNIKLGPLPAQDGEKDRKPISLATSGDSGVSTSTIAESARDRYVAPEMKDWTPIYRSGHYLIVPATIGKAAIKLFLLDTGAFESMISRTAASEVSYVFEDPSSKIVGINETVSHVAAAHDITIRFAGVDQKSHEMKSIDTSFLTGSTGVEISGFIGFPLLRELVLGIDYRDNLIHVVYDPRKGVHGE